MPLLLSAEHYHVFQKEKKKNCSLRDTRIFSFTLCDSGGCVNIKKKKKPEGQAAKDDKNNNYMQQQQQVSSSQIRALGALCRVLSQVWRERIALAIPRLQKVWTKYEANLFCAELERGEKKSTAGICFGLPVSCSLCGFLFTTRTSDFYYFLFNQWFNNCRLCHSRGFQRWIKSTYVPVQMAVFFFF